MKLLPSSPGVASSGLVEWWFWKYFSKIKRRKRIVIQTMPHIQIIHWGLSDANFNISMNQSRTYDVNKNLRIQNKRNQNGFKTKKSGFKRIENKGSKGPKPSSRQLRLWYHSHHNVIDHTFCNNHLCTSVILSLSLTLNFASIKLFLHTFQIFFFPRTGLIWK